MAMPTNLFKQYQRLLTLADAGLFYGNDEFDKERYKEIKALATTLLATITTDSVDKLTSVLAHSDGYPTPKVDVRVLIEENQQILLVQDKRTQQWSLPGGYAEVGYTPAENARKEVREETGLEVQIDELAAVYDTALRDDIPQLFQYYKLIFRATIVSGQFSANSETNSAKFFALDALPPLSKNRTTAEQIYQLTNQRAPYFE